MALSVRECSPQRKRVCSGKTTGKWNLPCVDGENHWEEVWGRRVCDRAGRRETTPWREVLCLCRTCDYSCLVSESWKGLLCSGAGGSMPSGRPGHPAVY